MKTLALAALRGLRHGHLTVLEGAERHEFGPPGADLRATVVVRSRATYGAVVGGGSVGLGRSYADGWWDCDDLTALVRILTRNLRPLDRAKGALDLVLGPAFDAMRRLRPPDKQRDRDEIHAHYDQGNEFFSLFLDETMTYSCGLFDSPAATLADAQRAKLDRICSLLDLGPDDHVREIGTGWGGFALHAAGRYGARVTTTTISDRQLAYARRRVAEAGLADRVEVVGEHYRDLRGTYDALVSIEMIEAIDWPEHDVFFAACAGLLHPEGRMALQAIVIDDRLYEQAKRRNDFIKEIVFPGSCLPSVASIVRSAAKAGLRVVSLDDIGAHYPETLRRWREDLAKHQAEAEGLGLSQPFLRMWELYLSYCEAGFEEGRISDVQVLFAKPGWRS